VDLRTEQRPDAETSRKPQDGGGCQECAVEDGSVKQPNERLAYLFEQAMETLRRYEPPEGYYLAFSGGKDSIVAYDLLNRSGCRFDAHMNLTSVDPPELLAYVKQYYPDVLRHRPEMTMFQLIEKKCFLPTARSRYCCAVLKERGGSNRIVVTGIRKAESHRRSKRQMLETSKTDKTKRMIHIIIDWKDKDVWQYIRTLNITYCSLYDEGFKRIGCIGCPMISSNLRWKQFQRWPRHKTAYRNTIAKALKQKASNYFGTDADLYLKWWLSNMSVKAFFGAMEQTDIFQLED
jgi:phosphoadenosine phosphosulfate reductase